MKWTYCITTVPERRWTTFPRSLDSLKQAGFTNPFVFVDGLQGDYGDLNLRVLQRERVRAFGNWYLALTEMWIRNPKSDRFAIFQDDLVTYKNLKSYLDTCTLTHNQYWNLYTFRENEKLRPTDNPSWYASNQKGRGAVGLVFPNEVVFKILTSEPLVAKPKAKHHATKCIDGALVDYLTKRKVTEMVHFPSLMQHIGTCSAIGNPQHPTPTSFLGEEYDAERFSRC